jgi:hypothetical protein
MIAKTAFFAILAFASAFPTQAEESAAAPATGKHLFILSGQSNMGPAGLNIAFTESVEKTYGKENVVVARYFRNSQPIRQWVRDYKFPPDEKLTEAEAEKRKQSLERYPNGGFYDGQMLPSLKKTMEKFQPTTITLIWMQGEEDANGTSETYADAFEKLIGQLRTDLAFENVTFVIGRINDFYLKRPEGKEIREIQQKLAESNPHGAWIDTDDLNTGINPWGVNEVDGGHFALDNYPVLGRRFADAADKLIGEQ